MANRVTNDFDFLKGNSVQVAPKLLGCMLERKVNDEVMRLKIVEVEAYDQADEASHSYKGNTPRTKVMFGEAGHLYVYFTYGMHYCCNVVTDKAGRGSVVLIRAVEPISGLCAIQKARSAKSVQELTNGPAKLCQALSIDKALNGHDLNISPLKLVVMPSLAPDSIIQTTRIGINHAKDEPWRFYIKGNKFVSHRLKNEQ